MTEVKTTLTRLAPWGAPGSGFLWRCWQDGAPYDPSLHRNLSSLRTAGVDTGHLTTEHPIVFTLDELVAELAVGPHEFGRRDAVERAVQDLAGVGLVHRHGQLVLPSRAALYFGRLWDEFQ